MRGARRPIHRERRPRVSTSLRAAMAGDGAGDVLTRFRAQRTALHFARKRYSLPRYSRANFCGNAVPISQHSLPKKPHRRIPWRCGAASRPAPVAVRVQHDPSLPAQCGGQMRDHCVRTNAQIELCSFAAGVTMSGVLISTAPILPTVSATSPLCNEYSRTPGRLKFLSSSGETTRHRSQFPTSHVKPIETKSFFEPSVAQSKAPD